MRPIVSGFVVVLADLSETLVSTGREYGVDGDGTLTFRVGDRVVATFPPGVWMTVRSVGQPLRADWPPQDFEYLMDNVLDALVVGQGWGMYGFRLDSFRDPAVNDFEAFVDQVIAADDRGSTPGLDSDGRRTACAIVAKIFDVENRHPPKDRGKR